MYSSWPTAISRKIFLPQGILLDLGGLFILLVTSAREWNAKFANAKPIGLRKILPYDSLHYPHWNVPLIVTTISISFAWSSDLVPSSPSFFTACKSDPPLSVLCSIFRFHKDGTYQISWRPCSLHMHQVVNVIPIHSLLTQASRDHTCRAIIHQWFPSINLPYTITLYKHTYSLMHISNRPRSLMSIKVIEPTLIQVEA